MFLVGRWLRRRNSRQQDSGEAWSPACSRDHRPFPTFSTSLLGPALETVQIHTNHLLPLRTPSKPILGPRMHEMVCNVFTPRARRVTPHHTAVQGQGTVSRDCHAPPLGEKTGKSTTLRPHIQGPQNPTPDAHVCHKRMHRMFTAARVQKKQCTAVSSRKDTAVGCPAAAE